MTSPAPRFFAKREFSKGPNAGPISVPEKKDFSYSRVPVRSLEQYSPNSRDRNFGPRLAALAFGLLLAASIAANWQVVGRVLGVITQGGSAVTLERVLDESFNLDLAGYIKGSQIRSTTTSSAPLVVASTVLVPNLNADLLDGQHGSYYLDASSIEGVSNSGGNIDLVAGSNVTITADDVANTITISSSATASGWVDEGTVVRLVTSTDRVGIGLSSPLSTLHVRSGASGSAGPHNVGDELVIENSTDGGISILTPDANVGYLIFGSPSSNINGYFGYNNTSQKLTLAIGGTPRYTFFASQIDFSQGTTLTTPALTDLILNPGDNVGIGISNPDGKLHVHTASAGAVSASVNADDLVVESSGNVGISLLAPASSMGSIEFTNPSLSAAGAIRYSHATNQLSLITNGGISALDLEVARAVFNDGALNYDFVVEGQTNPNLIVADASADMVGIGLVPTAAKLEVGTGADGLWTGKFTGSASAGLSYGLYVKAGTTSADKAFEVTDAGGTTEYFLVRGDGRVGIGIAPPDGTLHVHTGSAGSVTAAATSDDLVVENSGIAGMSLLTTDSGQTFFSMGSPADNNEAEMYWLDETGWFFFYKGSQYLGLRSSELVLNEGGLDIDLRVEGTAEANALFVDGSNGRVGIGNNSPSQALTVTDLAVGYVGSFFNDGNNDNRQGVFIQGCLDVNPTAACNFLELRDGDGGVLGAIEGNGAGGVTNASAGSDYAELFVGNRSDFGPGDLVSLGDEGDVVLAIPGTKLVGAYSSTPATLGNWHDGWENDYSVVPVGLLGQLRVKVSTENGIVRKGDPITVSPSRPGVGVKATGAGRILGFALEATPQEQNPAAVTLLLAYVSPSWYDPASEITSAGTLNVEIPDQLNVFGVEAKEGVFDKLTSLVSAAFESLTAKVAEITSAVIAQLTIGSSENPTGITIYDRQTGEPYCVSISGGELLKEPGECN
ncbi:hypothetical protein GTO10_06290 [Candidatus Saccharibacteria bacterium]|nr:hypothetical protein [Candidatus Saccharibacteria bacterium]